MIKILFFVGICLFFIGILWYFETDLQNSMIDFQNAVFCPPNKTDKPIPPKPYIELI